MMDLYVFINEKYKMTAKIIADSEDGARTKLPPLPPSEEWILKENSTEAPWDEKPKRWEYGELKLERIMTKTFGLYRAFEIDEFHEKLKEHIEWQQSYIDVNQLIVNQFAYHDEKYWWKGEDLGEMKRKADIFDGWEEGRCGYFKPGYGCNSPTGIGNSVMCRKLPDCEVLTDELLWKQVKATRDKLYEDLPTGDIDSFALLKVVKTHIAKLDEILEAS